MIEMSTKKDINLILGIMAVSLLLSSSINSAMATTSWHIGGNSITQSNTNELNADVNGVTPPGANARPPVSTTLYWIGGFTNNNYLTQVELRAWTSSTWKGFFETIRPTGTGLDIFQTNVDASNGNSVEMDTKLLGGSQVCNYIKKGALIASKCFTSATYGSTYSSAYAELESYDTTSSDFAPMSSPIQFTDYRGYQTGGSTYLLSLGPFSAGGPNPPACITSSAGTGTTTITESC